MPDTARTADDALELLDDLLKRALAHGADAADAVMIQSDSVGASWRMGKPEDLERSESRDVGLRVIRGKKQATVASTDLKPSMLEELAERANAMASVSPDDQWCGLADSALYAREVPDLDLDDHPDPDPERLIQRARAAEEAALAVDGVKQSEGGSAGMARTRMALAIRGGDRPFAASYTTSSHSVSCSVIAEDAQGHMERDYDFSSARHFADLASPEEVGRQAALNTVRRVGSRKMGSNRLPVVFDPRVANGLLGHFAAAINGTAIARGTSFLKNRMGERVFAEGIRVVDDPLRPRGLRSRPVDGEGVAVRRTDLIEDGILKTWMLDSATARQLGLQTTGHAGRGAGSSPSPGPSNLYLEPGEVSPEELIADITEGFYVTELIGFGVNGVTGDYSRGAAGFWIENGRIGFPVSEMTVAGNLKDMFLKLRPASDLVFRYGANAPTVRIDGMTVAGN
ncbi:TldD/PmbA family protein [Minwuia thermotolerans]|uniref:Modulator protein n=1 Tax=Minwuia thermotolerans TaxID=2056226 RepID=A0A2M9G4X2_9PROT|nr:TldD/PmbA family protein [Minwuia thermotolerans]PJK30758.1 modulator protein [Minwuia thermotolerans]